MLAAYCLQYYWNCRKSHFEISFANSPDVSAYKLEIFPRNPGQRGWYLNLIVKENCIIFGNVSFKPILSFSNGKVLGRVRHVFFISASSSPSGILDLNIVVLSRARL